MIDAQKTDMGGAEEITVLNGAVRLWQPPGGFRTSLDSVLVAAACPARAGERVLDLGCGVGGATFCLAWRVPGLMISGIDIQPQYIDLANKNIELNKNTERIEFLYGDVLIYRVSESSARYDHVLCNPPFLEGGTYTPSPDPGRATALGHGGQEGGLQDWIDCAFHNLKNGGVLTLIHRADHIDRIIRALGKKFGGVAIIPLYSKSGDPAKRVVVRAVKDSKAPAILHPGLVLHNPDGSYSAGADEILRGGRPLALP